ncbi:MAG: hypothetical protein ACK5V6_03365 [Pseudanabaena sp.]|jgi:IS1 family transposase
MSDLQHIEYLRGRVQQLEEQLRLERSYYQNELHRIAHSLSRNTKSVQNSISSLQNRVANNRRDSEVLFSSLWTIRE